MIKSGFLVVFYRREDQSKASREEVKTTQKIISLIQENPSITREKLAKLLNITPEGVKYHLTNLRKKGILRRDGGRKEGTWVIIANRYIKE